MCQDSVQLYKNEMHLTTFLLLPTILSHVILPITPAFNFLEDLQHHLISNSLFRKVLEAESSQTCHHGMGTHYCINRR